MKDLVHEDHLIPVTDVPSAVFGAVSRYTVADAFGPSKASPTLLSGRGGLQSGKRLGARTSAKGAYARFGKRALDIFLVVLTLPVSIPVTLFLAFALLLESGQPFYKQKRIGRGGREFSIWKLRTMVRDAESQLQNLLQNDPKLRAEWIATQKLKHDPRITPVGRLLRATSLDELPQLFNVLTGEMSLVGPRPMLPEQLPLYGDADAYCALRPGLSGPWQVSDRNESHFSYRAVLDRQYLNTLSLGQDIAIMFRTIGVILRRTGY